MRVSTEEKDKDLVMITGKLQKDSAQSKKPYEADIGDSDKISSEKMRKVVRSPI